MTTIATKFLLDGTAALRPKAADSLRAKPNVVVLPCKGSYERSCNQHNMPIPFRKRLQSWVSSTLNASEMFCSLKFEDMRGVVYGLFSKKDIRILCFASFTIAALAIAFGA